MEDAGQRPDRPWVPLIKSTSAGVALAATVGGDLLLIPRYGIVGAAAASSVAYALAAFVDARRYRLVMHRSLPSILLGR